MSSTNKYLLYGTGAVMLCAAFYWLSQDHEEAAFDPKVHTVEKLRALIHDLFVEGATLYCQKMNQIRTKRRDLEEEKSDPAKAKEEREKREVLTGKKEGPW
jgi:hypothetical protein